MDAELGVVIDRANIRHCIERLARGEDRRNAELIRPCWWPEAIYDYGVQNGNFDEYLAWVVPGADAIANTQHVLGQSYIELNGDTAKVETHVVSYHRVDYGGGDVHDTCIGGRYLDVMARRAGADGNAEWRIASRVMLYDWFQDWGASADWSQGVMGLPFTRDIFPGRAKGDHSENFFGKAS
ncbi:nuclear transport factor 2 family protein [Novosphingobium sp. BW1]|uniref:nuclear transport factor 2 family protein n=1 Tax=Novosphingobium sp. BW1 TaxID=2592621 RepID=UPI0011DEF523|nr:nuclear transport factor 2 family protein [Novosphingobium sp. BW1]TYC94354.1 nuclear transport factor 2 family protein [Novosphingobium sp. BW1]